MTGVILHLFILGVSTLGQTEATETRKFFKATTDGQKLDYELSFKNTVLHGKCKNYYYFKKKPTIAEEITFNNGVKDGPGRKYDDSGKLRAIFNYSNGYLKTVEEIWTSPTNNPPWKLDHGKVITFPKSLSKPEPLNFNKLKNDEKIISIPKKLEKAFFGSWTFSDETGDPHIEGVKVTISNQNLELSRYIDMGGGRSYQEKILDSNSSQITVNLQPTDDLNGQFPLTIRFIETRKGKRRIQGFGQTMLIKSPILTVNSPVEKIFGYEQDLPKIDKFDFEFDPEVK